MQKVCESLNNGKRKETCVIYVRGVDTKKATKRDGIINQINVCTHYAEGNNIEVLGVFKDVGLSGNTLDRPGLQEMIAFLETQNKDDIVVSYVVITEPNRLFRMSSLVVTFNSLNIIRQLGTEVISLLGWGKKSIKSETKALSSNQQADDNQ